VSNYELLKQVGKGGFSRVILARQRSSGRLCAMKVISIEELQAHGKFTQVALERRILKHLSHAFICPFIEGFRTQKFLHFVLEFCPAGELFFHLSKNKRFGEAEACEITAEIVLALEHLHSHDIIYRDLKPENVLVDFHGHVKLTDFGLCKQLRSKNDFSKSLCGSPEYVSPEMLITGKHSRMVDFYQLGALLYELLTGLPPLYSHDKTTMFKQIAIDEPAYPSYLSPSAKSLLRGLLQKKPEQRLGYAQGFSEVKYSAFFSRIDWQKLPLKERAGPLRPRLNGFYFDSEYVEELSAQQIEEMSLKWSVGPARQ